MIWFVLGMLLGVVLGSAFAHASMPKNQAVRAHLEVIITRLARMERLYERLARGDPIDPFELIEANMELSQSLIDMRDAWKG